jgi:hypothetical protein
LAAFILPNQIQAKEIIHLFRAIITVRPASAPVCQHQR